MEPLEQEALTNGIYHGIYYIKRGENYGNSKDF